MKYEPVKQSSHKEVEEAILRDDPEELLEAVLSAALHSDEPRWSESICLRLSNHLHFNVRGNAILGFAHIARIHGRLSENKVKPVIEAALNDESDYVRSQANAAAVASITVISDASFSCLSPRILEALVSHLQKKRLFDQITVVGRDLGLDSESRTILRKGREARNALAHELTLALAHQVESDSGPDVCLGQLKNLIEDLAANLIVGLCSLLATDEPMPTMEFTSQCGSRAVDWVCEVDNVW